MRIARLGLVLGVAPGIPPVDAETPPTDPLAEVNREAITAKDLEQALGAKLAALEEEIYSLKRQGVEALIAERLLAQEAARRGVSVASLLDAEVTRKVEPVTQDEVEVVYQANKTAGPETRLPSARTSRRSCNGRRRPLGGRSSWNCSACRRRFGFVSSLPRSSARLFRSTVRRSAVRPRHP